MAEQKTVGAGTIDTTKFVQADPTKNPRFQLQKEIWEKSAARADAEAAETMPQDALPEEFEPAPKEPSAVEVKPEGSPALEEPAKEESAASEDKTEEQEASAVEDGSEPQEGVDTIEPDAVYEVTVEGKKVEVEGAKLIEAGIRTYQKEAAADVKLATANERLQLASKLLEEAQRRTAALPQGAPTADEAKKGAQEDVAASQELNDLELAKAIQFGTEEQAAAALKKLRATGRAVSPEEIGNFVRQSVPMMVRQELLLNDARQYASTEFKDIMEKPLLKSLFDAMEMQARQTGDQTPPRELYAKIGEVIRTQLGMPIPTSKPNVPTTTEERKAAKKAAPTMPRTAVARLEQGTVSTKAPTASEIIAGIAARRGQGSLTFNKPQ